MLSDTFRAKAWPRTGLRSRLFHGKLINGFTWKHPSHINVLELQATVHALQWRLRKVARFRHRVLHLVDNQVVASVISKGRTSSPFAQSNPEVGCTPRGW